jgi:hypothetical protein
MMVRFDVHALREFDSPRAAARRQMPEMAKFSLQG